MSEIQDRRRLDHWSVDKRIPLALVLAIAVQTGAAVWWAATISGRVDSVMMRVATIEKDGEAAGELKDRIVRLEVTSETTAATLMRMEGKIDDLRKEGP